MINHSPRKTRWTKTVEGINPMADLTKKVVADIPNPQPSSKSSRFWHTLKTTLFFIALWSVIIFLIVQLFRSDWRDFTKGLSAAADIVWPLAAVIGLVLMFTAYCCRSTQKDYGAYSEAYSFMRGAALSFLLGFSLLWLRYRRFL